ncbi:MAG: ABC transporter substrate-binding protein, partial [Chloroflexota bacterium]
YNFFAKEKKMKKTYLLILLIVALFLAACSGAEEPVAPESAAEPAAEEEAAVVEEEAAEEEAADAGPKIFTWAEAIDPFDIDPRTAYDGQGHPVLGQAYETLTHFNPPGSDTEISPELAVSWESNEDATEWTFVLQEGVVFHDGEPFNAEAVKALVENVRDGEFATSWVFGSIAEIEVVDDLTIKFTNAYPAKLDLIFTSAFGAWMVSPNALDKGGDWFAEGNSAGTGPYKIVSREPGTRIVMERHDEYWGGWNDKKFDTVVIEYIPDPTVREQMIRAGDIDLTRELDFDNLASLQEAEGVDVKILPAYNNQFIMLNNARPPLDNVLVRQALVASYPYEAVIENLIGGHATPAGGAIPQTMWGADEGAIVTQDLDKARELLAEAGFADGFEMDYWAYEGDPTLEQIGEVWIPVLRELNIELNVTVIDFNAAMEAFWNEPDTAHHAVGLGWFPTYVTPFDPLFSPFSTGEYFNVAAYDNEDFTNLLFDGDALTATDQDAAIAAFQQANQMLIDDGAAIFAFDVPMVWQVRDDIDGFYYSPAYGTVIQAYNLER